MGQFRESPPMAAAEAPQYLAAHLRSPDPRLPSPIPERVSPQPPLPLPLSEPSQSSSFDQSRSLCSPPPLVPNHLDYQQRRNNAQGQS